MDKIWVVNVDYGYDGKSDPGDVVYGGQRYFFTNEKSAKEFAQKHAPWNEKHGEGGVVHELVRYPDA